MTSSVASLRPRSFAPLLALVVPAAGLAWAFWTTLVDMAQVWQHNAQYSHGYLVPLFSGLLLWLRRERLDVNALRPSPWGFVVLAVGIGLRLFGAYFHYVWLDAIALLPCLAGLTLLLGGWAAWRWAWPSLAFLAFMIPLPYRVSASLSGPLQRLATVCSTYIMQTLGLPALYEGNVILLDEHKIGIVEACNGLSMMMVFFALATAVAMLMRRPLTDRFLVLLSAVPISLVANITRVTVTGLLFRSVSSETAHAFFHDVAGWFMMPLALALLWLELQVLSHLFLDVPVSGRRVRQPATLRQPAVRAPRTPRRAPVAPRERPRPVAEPQAPAQEAVEKS